MWWPNSQATCDMHPNSNTPSSQTSGTHKQVDSCSTQMYFSSLKCLIFYITALILETWRTFKYNRTSCHDLMFNKPHYFLQIFEVCFYEHDRLQNRFYLSLSLSIQSPPPFFSVALNSVTRMIASFENVPYCRSQARMHTVSIVLCVFHGVGKYCAVFSDFALFLYFFFYILLKQNWK